MFCSVQEPPGEEPASAKSLHTARLEGLLRHIWFPLVVPERDRHHRREAESVPSCWFLNDELIAFQTEQTPLDHRHHTDWTGSAAVVSGRGFDRGLSFVQTGPHATKVAC